MNYDCILFDLDGTLTDPGLGITNSVMYALNAFGIETPDRRELYKFIGPPLLDSFARFYGMSPADCREALRLYRVRFVDGGMFENEVYPGIPRLLERLKAAGYRLLVATSKPEPYSIQILEHFGLAGYFEFIAGSSMDETRSTKDAVIAYALERAGITDPGRAIMVGDRLHDVEGAAANGMRCIGVLYGYGSREELEAAGAVRLAEDPEVLGSLLLSGTLCGDI